MESENTRVKDELYEKCTLIEELQKVKNVEENLEMDVSRLSDTHKTKVDFYEEIIFKEEVELKELRKLVCDCGNISNEKDSKELILKADIQKVQEGVVWCGVVDDRGKLIKKQNDYIKSLEEFLEMYGEATDELYSLQKEMETKDTKLTMQDSQLKEARDLIIELNNVAEKSEMTRLQENKDYEIEKEKWGKVESEFKAMLVEKDEQLENNSREREKILGFLETVKDMIQFAGDDNFPLINQLEGLKECLSEKLKVLLMLLKYYDKVQKPAAATTAKTTVKTVKQPISQEKSQLHTEDLPKRGSGLGPEESREEKASHNRTKRHHDNSEIILQ